jgi:hypothetical protein
VIRSRNIGAAHALLVIARPRGPRPRRFPPGRCPPSRTSTRGTRGAAGVETGGSVIAIQARVGSRPPPPPVSRDLFGGPDTMETPTPRASVPERNSQPKAMVAPTGPEPVVQPREGSNQVRCGAKYSDWAVSAPFGPVRRPSRELKNSKSTAGCGGGASGLRPALRPERVATRSATTRTCRMVATTSFECVRVSTAGSRLGRVEWGAGPSAPNEFD